MTAIAVNSGRSRLRSIANRLAAASTRSPLDRKSTRHSSHSQISYAVFCLKKRLQGYDGHLQLLADAGERRSKCLEGMEKLIATRRLIEKAGIPVAVVTGAGTGTWEFVASCD